MGCRVEFWLSIVTFSPEKGRKLQDKRNNFTTALEDQSILLSHWDFTFICLPESILSFVDSSPPLGPWLARPQTAHVPLSYSVKCWVQPLRAFEMPSSEETENEKELELQASMQDVSAWRNMGKKKWRNASSPSANVCDRICDSFVSN